MNDAAIRDIIRPHRDGGSISRLYTTGEIDTDTIPDLGLLAHTLDQEGHHEEAEQIGDVIAYARDAGERPPVTRWAADHTPDHINIVHDDHTVSDDAMRVAPEIDEP